MTQFTSTARWIEDGVDGIIVGHEQTRRFR
jgi:hypothetical protein